MADNNTLAYNSQVNQQTRNVVRLAQYTKEATYYPVGSETEVRLQALVVSETARVANDTAKIAHLDTVEVN